MLFLNINQHTWYEFEAGDAVWLIPLCRRLRRLYNHILSLDPQNATAVREVGQVNAIKKLEEQARSAIESEHYNNAISLADRVLALAPGNTRAKLIQAECYVKQNDVRRKSGCERGVAEWLFKEWGCMVAKGACENGCEGSVAECIGSMCAQRWVFEFSCCCVYMVLRWI